MQHVLENVATASRAEPLSGEERVRLAAMLEENKKLAQLYCTGCAYCMPCPSNVDIPGNFTAMNYYWIYGLKEYVQHAYARLGRHKVEGEAIPARAASCLECGPCEEKCPQHIPTMAQIKEVEAALGQP
ncbi:MAG: 4Fe-4S dicluster domain-containing protein [Armatimonadetes bacterium]|nr:4Fe-4S dicluster domain-containing protein [Armatimonadota bacterium]